MAEALKMEELKAKVRMMGDFRSMVNINDEILKVTLTNWLTRLYRVSDNEKTIRSSMDYVNIEYSEEINLIWVETESKKKGIIGLNLEDVVKPIYSDIEFKDGGLILLKYHSILSLVDKNLTQMLPSIYNRISALKTPGGRVYVDARDGEYTTIFEVIRGTTVQRKEAQSITTFRMLGENYLQYRVFGEVETMVEDLDTGRHLGDSEYIERINPNTGTSEYFIRIEGHGKVELKETLWG